MKDAASILPFAPETQTDFTRSLSGAERKTIWRGSPFADALGLSKQTAGYDYFGNPRTPLGGDLAAAVEAGTPPPALPLLPTRQVDTSRFKFRQISINSPIRKLERLSRRFGRSPEAILEHGLTGQQFRDYGNGGNINILTELPQATDQGELIRVTLNPDGTEIISAGTMLLDRVQKLIGSGRLHFLE